MRLTAREQPVAERSEAIAGVVCPDCRGPLVDAEDEVLDCEGCRRSYPLVAGIPDLRRRSDRYLDLESERSKAVRLSERARRVDLAGLVSYYYDVSPDVGARRALFEARVASAELRGAALALDLPARGRIIELGCGTGGLLSALSKSGREVVGADIASRWLVVARKRLDATREGASIPLIAAEAERLPWEDDRFDVVVADSLLEHVDDPSAVLSECLRVLRPRGLLRLWSPNRWFLGIDPHVDLWGVGLFPRELGLAYAGLRRDGAWLPRLYSARSAERAVKQAGFERVKTGPPQIDRERLTRMIGESRSRIYSIGMRFAIVRYLLKTFGPIWSLSAEKPA